MRSADASQSELVRQIRVLREELNWYYHRVELEQLGRDGDRSPERLELLQRQLRDREQTFIRVLRELPVDDRESVGLHDTTAITPGDLRTTLAPDTALIEYFVTGDRVLAAVLTADDLTIVPLTTVSSVRQLLRSFQFQLSKFQFGAEYLAKVDHGLLQATQGHLQALYDELLAPLAIGTRKRLVIVPHDLLHYVPFHALFDGQSYLAESTSVSYAPSASVYALCCRRAASASATSLVLGVPDERAPFITDEVRAVAGMLPGAELHVGASATADVLRRRGATSRVVHIATHGFFREDNPLFSGVRLGDSYLTLHDLYDLRLPADLIALSGCGTGLQAIAAGDEMRGLVRGLLAGGARSVLVTLWNVHDRSTAVFMTSFYRHLGTGGDKAAALQLAMADLRQEYPHPYYWAPFILVGADRGPTS
jgi:CHAT domain-containing protein